MRKRSIGLFFFFFLVLPMENSTHLTKPKMLVKIDVPLKLNLFCFIFSGMLPQRNKVERKKQHLKKINLVSHFL